MSEYQEVNRRSRKAGIQGAEATAVALHSRFREGDDTLQQIMLVSFRAGLLEPLVSPRLGLGLIAGNIVSTTGEVLGARRGALFSGSDEVHRIRPHRRRSGSRKSTRANAAPRGRIRQRSPAVNR